VFKLVRRRCGILYTCPTTMPEHISLDADVTGQTLGRRIRRAQRALLMIGLKGRLTIALLCTGMPSEPKEPVSVPNGGHARAVALPAWTGADRVATWTWKPPNDGHYKRMEPALWRASGVPKVVCARSAGGAVAAWAGLAQLRCPGTVADAVSASWQSGFRDARTSRSPGSA
jgi:hypothetical protein